MATGKTSTYKFDIFISHDIGIQDRVRKLHDALIVKHDLSIWFDVKSHEKGDNTIYEAEIQNSRMVLACLSKEYLKSAILLNEIAMAYTADKPILVLMFQKMSMEDLREISYILESSIMCNLFEDFKNVENWSPLIFEKINHALETTLKIKLNVLKRTAVKKRNDLELLVKKSIKPKNEPRKEFAGKKCVTNLISAVYRSEANVDTDDIETSTILAIAVEEIEIATHENSREMKLLMQIPSKIKLVKYKSNSLLNYTYGFNRIVFLEPRQRYIITSSYRNCIISVDTMGNWIEKRNPDNLLRKPWGICLNSSNEIFVGDNQLRTIFVFDIFFKCIRKIIAIGLNSIFDMTIDQVTGDLYAADMFGGVVAVFNTTTDYKIKRKLCITSPAFIRVIKNKIFIVSASDLLYILEKVNLQVCQTIIMRNSKYVSGLHVDDALNVFTISHQTDDDEKKSREVYLNILKHTNEVVVHRFELGITQSNDLVVWKNKLCSVSDTHVDIFEFDQNSL